MVRFGMLFALPATRPGLIAGVTLPKPTPNAVIVSPGAAGRNASPGIRFGLPTYVDPSVNNATRYCLPPTLKLGGASSPGAMEAFCTVTGALVPAQLVTVSRTAPVTGSAGACKLICDGL